MNLEVACIECDRDFWIQDVRVGETFPKPMCADCQRLAKLDRVDRAASHIIEDLRDLQTWSRSENEQPLMRQRLSEIAGELLRTYRMVNA